MDDVRPLILAAHGDADALERITDELERRYGHDYRVLCEAGGAAALSHLEAARDRGERVALVLAAHTMPEHTGAELLALARDLHPHSKRGMLVAFGAWGDAETTSVIVQAMATGTIDYYVLEPWRSPDELFHRTVTEFLQEWARTGDQARREIAVVGPAEARRTYELRDLLTRNGVPHEFHANDTDEGRLLLAEHGAPSVDVPVVLLLDGRALIDPSDVELARAYGVSTELGNEHDFDIIVIGAGPAGLAAAVYASSEGLRALVVERRSIGGQAGSSSRIRNYLGFSRGVSGAELAQRAYQQAWVFGTRFLLMRDASSLDRSDGRYVVSFSDGEEATAPAIVLATGVSYVRLGVPALEALVGVGVYYGASASEAPVVAGRRVFVVGGGNSAGQAAIHLSAYAAQVTLVVRATTCTVSMSSYLYDEILATPNIDLRMSTEIVDGAGDGRLEQLTLRDRETGATTTVPADALFVLIGARPHTDWLPETIARDERGFLRTGHDVTDHDDVDWPLERRPLSYETSLPGVFAVGDVRSGSVKRVASAVGEGSVVIQQVFQAMRGEQASMGT